jgi:hypothetical protein
VLRHEVLRLFLPRHQPVLVKDHLHVLFPKPPRFPGNALVNALPEFSRLRHLVESLEIFLKLHAVDRTAALVGRRRVWRRGRAGSHDNLLS